MSIAGRSGVPALLWELDPLTNTWRNLGAPATGQLSAGGPLDNSPAISAALVPGHTVGNILRGHVQVVGPEIWVAVRTGDMNVWTCHYNPSPGARCQWDNATAGTGRTVSSDVSIISTGFGLRVYGVSPAGVLEQFTPDGHGGGAWRDLPPASDTTVSPGGVSATEIGGEIRVAVGAHSGSSPDNLFLFRTIDGGASWGSTELFMPQGEPFLGYATRQRSSIDQAWRETTTGHFVSAVYVDGLFGDALVPCAVPGLPSPVPGPSASAACEAIAGVPSLERPADLMPFVSEHPLRDFIGPAVVGAIVPAADIPSQSVYHAFTSGSLATTGYVYQMEAPSEGQPTPTWHNLLAPRDSLVQLDGLSAEFVSDEFFGDVVVGDTRSSSLRSSQDDGNSWGPAVTPIGMAGDLALTIDGSGVPYAVALGAPARRSMQISRRLTQNTWSFPVDIPSTINARVDRPWLVADRSVPGRLFLAWSNSSAGTTQATYDGRIAYSTGTLPATGCEALGNCAPCDGACPIACPASGVCSGCDRLGGRDGHCTSDLTAAWCPSSSFSDPEYRLPSTTGCASGFELIGGGGEEADTGAPGCPIAQTGDGEVWIAVGDDELCSARDPAQHSANIGLRRITNRAALGLQGCVPPVFSAEPECIFYDGRRPEGVLLLPAGRQHAWSVSLAPAHDSGALSLTLHVYRALDGSRCITDSGSPCRTDIASFVRLPSGAWLAGDGSAVSLPLDEEDFVFVNSDHGDGRHVDHILGEPVLLDRLHFGVVWMDTRTSPGTGVDYWVMTRSSHYGSVFDTIELPPWSFTPSAFRTTGLVPDHAYLDINQAASAHLHAHFVVDTSSGVDGAATARTRVWAPRSW